MTRGTHLAPAFPVRGPVTGEGPADPAEERLALYCHIPFCASRCHYCDFVTYTGLESHVAQYVRALEAEAAQVAVTARAIPPIGTVYLGGGTPSLLPADELHRLLKRLGETFSVDEDAEVTVEVNPGDTRLEWLRTARAAGVNRLSIGMQSSDDQVLKLLGRRHLHADTCRTVRLSRQVGFDNLSLDLIYGLPGQSVRDWRRTVEDALALDPAHLSAYALSLEPGTAMASWVWRGLVEAPDEDRAADQYECLEDRLEREGFTHYEISNWARGEVLPDGHPVFACRHNLAYWENRPYLGLGAGAHGCAAGVRYAACRSVTEYVARILLAQGTLPFPMSPAMEWSEAIGPVQAARDTMLLGLRLTSVGVTAQEYSARHGGFAWAEHRSILDRLADDGLVEWRDAGTRVRLTRRGRLLGNRVFAEFV